VIFFFRVYLSTPVEHNKDGKRTCARGSGDVEHVVTSSERITDELASKADLHHHEKAQKGNKFCCHFLLLNYYCVVTLRSY
jgi:hypothetical protein